MPEHGRIPSACPLITNWDPHEAGNLLRMGVETPQEVQPTRAQLPWFDIPTGSSGLAAGTHRVCRPDGICAYDRDFDRIGGTTRGEPRAVHTAGLTHVLGGRRGEVRRDSGAPL